MRLSGSLLQVSTTALVLGLAALISTPAQAQDRLAAVKISNKALRAVPAGDICEALQLGMLSVSEAELHEYSVYCEVMGEQGGAQSVANTTNGGAGSAASNSGDSVDLDENMPSDPTSPGGEPTGDGTSG